MSGENHVIRWLTTCSGNRGWNEKENWIWNCYHASSSDRGFDCIVCYAVGCLLLAAYEVTLAGLKRNASCRICM